MDYARLMIGTSEYVVCVCGQIFHQPEPYADHVEQCEHVKRGEVAAQGKVDFEKA